MVFFDSEKISGKGVANIASDTEGMSPIQKIKYLYDYMHSEEYKNDIEKIKAQRATAADSSEGGGFGGRGEESVNIEADSGKQDAFNGDEDISAQNNNGIDTDNALSEYDAVNADGVDEVGGVGSEANVKEDAGIVNEEDQKNVINGENDIANGDGMGYKEINNQNPINTSIKELKYRPTSGVILKATLGKTTTIIGRYFKDTVHIIRELGDRKTTDIESAEDGYNVLNLPDHLTRGKTDNEIWEYHNKKWLYIAVKRGDIIFLATKPIAKELYKFNYKTRKIELTMFGREIQYLKDIRGYTYDKQTMQMIPPKK